MKISKKYLQDIIDQELKQVILENLSIKEQASMPSLYGATPKPNEKSTSSKKNNIINNIKSKLPTILKHDLTMEIGKQIVSAARSKKIDLMKALKLTTALGHLASRGPKAAEFALKHKTKFEDLGFKIEIGDITSGGNVDDLSRSATYDAHIDDNLAGGRQDPGKTYGVQLSWNWG